MRRSAVAFSCILLVILVSGCDRTSDYPEMATTWVSATGSGLEEVRYMVYLAPTQSLLAGGIPKPGHTGLSRFDRKNETWALVTDNLPADQQVSWLAVSGDTVWISLYSNPFQPSLLAVSHDYGQSFTETIPLPGVAGVRCFVPGEKNSDTLLLGTVNDGLFLTDDRGISWRSPSVPLSDPGIQSLAVNSGNALHVLAGVRTGLWESRDRGENWKAITSRLLSDKYFVVEVTAHPHKPDCFICILRDDLGAAYVYISTDGAGTWSPIRTGFYPDSQPRCIAYHPSLPDTLFAGTVMDGIYRSDSLGQDWFPINRGLPLEGAIVIAHCLLPVNGTTPFLYTGLNINGEVLYLDIH